MSVTILELDKPVTEESPQSEKDKLFLANARELFSVYQEADSKNRAEAEEDLKFFLGGENQWSADIRMQRIADARPCLTTNRIPQFVNQVVSEQRQQRPSIVVNPQGNGATKGTARLLQGMIRHIEVQSDAEVAYDKGFDAAVKVGFGFWRIVSDYPDERAMQQEVYIRPIHNSFSVYMDPASRDHDYGDAMGLFIITDLSRQQYTGDYKDTKLGSLTDWTGTGIQAPEWLSRDGCRIAEYFEIQEHKKKLYKTKSFGPLFEDEIQKMEVNQEEEIVSQEEGDGWRWSKVREVHWYKFNAIEVLEHRVLPGRRIPVIPVFGYDMDIAGVRRLVGMIRNAKDPQRMYNFWVSAQTEMIALAPKAPYVAAAGQIEDYKDEWAAANRRNMSVLRYTPQEIKGTIIPPPQRSAVEPPIAAITEAIIQSDNDLKATMGIYEPSLGQNRGQQSGRAISLLQRQGEVANFQFIDNLKRAIRTTGVVLLDWIAAIYDTEQVVRIVNPDGTMQDQTINAEYEEQGIKKILRPGVGRYDITVTTGPSYATKRQEAAASMLQLVQAYPALLPVAGDIMIKNMDWEGAEQVAKRIAKTLPPNLQDPDPDKPETQVPPQLQTKLAQDAQMIEQLTGKVNQLSEQIETKQMELASKEYIAGLQETTKLLLLQSKLQADGAQAGLTAEMDRIKHLLDMNMRRIEAELAARQDGEEGGEGGGGGADKGEGGGPTGGDNVSAPSIPVPSFYPYGTAQAHAAAGKQAAQPLAQQAAAISAAQGPTQQQGQGQGQGGQPGA